MQTKPTIMLIGLGGLGSLVLELLAREEGLGRIIVGSRNAVRGMARCNLARLGAMAQGYAPDIRFVSLDLNDKEAVAEMVHRETPNIILSTATMQTWWLPDLLPPKQAAVIKGAGFGVWLPVHLTLTRKLMEALRHAAYRGITLTAPYPDVVNCVLGCLDLAPTCGVGNVDEIVPKVRLLAAERLAASPNAVRVLLVAHHALLSAVFGEPTGEIPPYFLRVEYGGQDVTEAVCADELLLTPCPLPSGPVTNFLTTGSIVQLIRAFLSDGEALLHAPAPNGLPGGYPVLVNSNGVRPAPIEGLTLAKAIAINERSHRFDGIERIETDGTVVFCPAAADVLRRELGYDCDQLAPHESEERAKDLIARFREYAGRYGVNLSHET
jgi:NAD(P)-dependent dehydrogenase (short-subunit alcohol dehydrogenase family)